MYMPKDSKKAGCFNIRIKVNQNAKISPLPHCENQAMGEIIFVLEIGEESSQKFEGTKSTVHFQYNYKSQPAKLTLCL